MSIPYPLDKSKHLVIGVPLFRIILLFTSPSYLLGSLGYVEFALFLHPKPVFYLKSEVGQVPWQWSCTSLLQEPTWRRLRLSGGLDTSTGPQASLPIWNCQWEEIPGWGPGGDMGDPWSGTHKSMCVYVPTDPPTLLGFSTFSWREGAQLSSTFQEHLWPPTLLEAWGLAGLNACSGKVEVTPFLWC